MEMIFSGEGDGKEETQERKKVRNRSTLLWKEWVKRMKEKGLPIAHRILDAALDMIKPHRCKKVTMTDPPGGLT